MQKKLPSFQFYPGDWRKDPGVQSLSYHDRGVWFEMLCLMHESEQRGRLTLNGASMPEDALARLLGVPQQLLHTTISTLIKFGVCSWDPESGCLLNRRMVRDEEIRQSRAAGGRLGGGNPNFKKGEPNPYYPPENKDNSLNCNSKDNHNLPDNLRDNQRHKQKINPSSSSSSSSSLKTKKPFVGNETAFRLSEFLFSKIKKRNNGHRPPNLKKWAIEIDRLIKVDARDPTEIEKVIEWCQEDQFWQNNILSTAKLREKYDQLKLKMVSSKPKDVWDEIIDRAKEKDKQDGQHRANSRTD